MKAVKYMDEEMVIKRGIDLLMKGLGPLEAIRFMNISRERRMESVKRHRKWQKHLNKEEFFNEVFQ
ncbi:MAG: hypothetical protein Q7I89_01100 [Syntrophales bacterium]|nr:hypothetical protein [Syntrophales bacterium]